MCSVNNNINTDCSCVCKSTNKYDTVIKSCCIIYLLLLSSLDIQSQDLCDKSISGKVIDKETNNPLPDVIVRAISNPQVYGNRVLYNSSDKFSISDENGKFLLENLCADEDSLIFSRIGYQDTLISLDANYWTVSLTEKSVELENVIISDEREKILGVIPWFRPSTAVGYSQALTKTWDDYKDETGNTRANRKNFSDSADFIGWYASKGYYQGFEKTDARSLYLAYHEGYGGFEKKSYRKKQWLINVADRVQARSTKYQKQYWGCAKELKKKKFIFF